MKAAFKKRYIRIVTAAVMLLLNAHLIKASQAAHPEWQSDNDSIRAAAMITEGRQFFLESRYDTALNILGQVLEIAVNGNYPVEEAETYYLMGQITDRFGEWELTLRYYLKSASIFERQGMRRREAEIYSLISSKYYDLEVYDKSAEYRVRIFNLCDRDDMTCRANASLEAAISLFRDENYDSAVAWYDTCYQESKAEAEYALMVRSLYGLSGSWGRLMDYEKEMEYLNLLAEVETARGDAASQAEIYNSIGLLNFRKGEYSTAIENFESAAVKYRDAGSGAESALSNIAVCYQNLNNRRLTDYYFEEALTESKRSGNLSEQARLEHILAVLNYNDGDLYHAGFYSRASISSAREAKNLNVLVVSYQTYSNVLEAGNDFVKALEYYEKYLSLRDSLALEQKLIQQAREQRRFEIASFEQQLRLNLASDEIKDLALRNLRIEAEKRENNLILVERERELERSERERLQQSVDLDRERYNRVLQEKEISELEQERAIQQLELIQRENAERELLREKRLLESEARQQELVLANEQESKKRVIWMVALLGIIALTILGSLISSRKKNAVLTARKKEIEEINSDLERKNEEVLRSNRQISEQKEIIEEKNQSITDSIEYASRIQSAVLPPIGIISEWGYENFILFRPKDIVSGDFYWGLARGAWVCFAAADCTGHGVPGAFMSMLGTAYLNDIVNSRRFETAADILNMLREEVIQSLKQRGVEGEAQDGMDISLCLINRDTGRLHFSGANNPLYFIRKGDFRKIEADKMPIGIHRMLDQPFSNHTIDIEPGDVIYLFSDGYADQFGGDDGKKFKYKAFREMLHEIHDRPMDEQQAMIEERFNNWKGINEQVDDVLVIGVRFK